MALRTFTSASANKHLRLLADQKNHLLDVEREVSTYRALAGEQPEPPEYDYAQMRTEIDAIDAQMLAIRHALHKHNAATVLPCGLTVDEALIAMAQLSQRKLNLQPLRAHRPKERVHAGMAANAQVEYEYANYDIEQAERDYNETSERIGNLQLEIDLSNQTATFEVDLP